MTCEAGIVIHVQICGQTVGDMVVVDDMHQRKAEMARLADAFIALPGIYINIPVALLPPLIWFEPGDVQNNVILVIHISPFFMAPGIGEWAT